MISISPSGHVIRHTKRKARDSNPHPVEREPRLAERPGQPYPATFQYFSGPTGNRTRISSHARAGVVPLDHQPVSYQWTAGESNPDRLTLQGSGVLLWTSQPVVFRGPSGS